MADRTFKVKFSGQREFSGRYTGKTPRQAASKAFSKHVRGKAARGKVTFTVVETTRGSGDKERVYVAERVKLVTPTSYKLKSGKTIVRKYKNVIRAK